MVDRLLAGTHSAERWGRHWMDIWRYSDWWGLGAELRNSQKHIWHWRDWIIESLDADKGYDQMVREMIAADEIGFDSEENRHYVTDVHATIPHLLGLGSRKWEIAVRKRQEIDYGQPIRQMFFSSDRAA
ncbi:DUF1549 domain-containing protein [Singulisphaera sp. Ch08]|uniref:DUF1549 domain-containing protein n=1 Tax=Singulisphaera sp. Ch08 TaxID=3120278 RepID=A0AAU7C7S5_9BACT